MKILPCASLACASLACALLASATLSPALVSADAPAPTAVFNFSLDDTSPQPGQPADEKRLEALDGQLRDMLAKSGCCQIIPLGAVARQAQDTDMSNCNGCDVDLARKLGAKLSVTGWVQKVSNLILNINLVARNVTTGQVIEEGSVDIRGNTDESWSRGLTYLLHDRLHLSKWQ